VAGSIAGAGDIPEECHPKIREIAEYWRAICPSRGLPSRRQIDPTRIFRLLPEIRLIDVIGTPARFRVRLTGERIREKLGALHTGLFLDEVVESFAERDSGIAFAAAVRNKRPHWDRGLCDQTTPPDGYAGGVKMERVVLPFSEDGATVDALLVLVVFGDAYYEPLPLPR